MSVGRWKGRFRRAGSLLATVSLLVPSLLLTLNGAAAAEPRHGPAAPGDDGRAVSCAIVNEADVTPPAGSKKIIDAVMRVQNDEDTGMVGYWALDHYTKRIEVWRTPSGSYYAGVLYSGGWQTFAGALSPEQGVAEPADGVGPMDGGYVATFTASQLSSPGKPTHGYIGSFDLGGAKGDILLGTYSRQTGNTRVVDWLSFYFGSVSGFNQPSWGWVYRYRSGEQWCNTSASSTGDIVTSAHGGGEPEASDSEHTHP